MIFLRDQLYKFSNKFNYFQETNKLSFFGGAQFLKSNAYVLSHSSNTHVCPPRCRNLLNKLCYLRARQTKNKRRRNKRRPRDGVGGWPSRPSPAKNGKTPPFPLVRDICEEGHNFTLYALGPTTTNKIK